MKNIVNVPKELISSRRLLSETINRDYDKIALILLGSNMDHQNYREDLSFIRLYLFMKEGGKYLKREADQLIY